MLIRALIVLLVVLNLGVAAWWITQPPAASPAPAPLPAGVARLQLLEEVAPRPPAGTAPTPPVSSAGSVVATPAPQVAAAASEITPTATVATEPKATAPPEQCFHLGPYADATAATAAAARIGSLATRSRSEQRPGKSAGPYNVSLPPVPDRQAAQALAQRIGAAGFDDFLVNSSGAQVNGIALGRYASREAAERRQAALQAAGFPAQVQAVGEEGAAQWWLQAVAGAGTTAAQLQRAAAATQARSLDCAVLR